MVRLLVLAILLAACKGDRAPATVEQLDGTVTIGGAPAKITRCYAAPVSEKAALHLALDAGLTVIVSPVDGFLVAEGGAAPAKLECTRAQNRWSSGSAGKRHWAQGTLQATCAHPRGEIVIDLTYDCGAKDRPSNARRKP